MRQFSSNSNRVMALDDPWFFSESRFRSISLERIDGIWPNFGYALMLTRSRLGLLRINFHKFITELWPLIDVRILFPLNILRTNWWILTKICICIDIDKGLLHDNFCKFITVLWPLIDDRILFLLNILRTNLWTLAKFCICIDTDIEVGIFTNLQQSCGPWLMSEFHFRLISWEQIDGIWPNFAYALILTRSWLGFLGVSFC